MALISAGVALPKINESSAKRRLVIFGALLQIETPYKLPPISALSNSEVNPSVHNKNKYGERGSP